VHVLSYKQNINQYNIKRHVFSRNEVPKRHKNVVLALEMSSAYRHATEACMMPCEMYFFGPDTTCSKKRWNWHRLEPWTLMSYKNACDAYNIVAVVPPRCTTHWWRVTVVSDLSIRR